MASEEAPTEETGSSLLLNQPVVIDNGTATLKAGFAGSSKPKVSRTLLRTCVSGERSLEAELCVLALCITPLIFALYRPNVFCLGSHMFLSSPGFVFQPRWSLEPKSAEPSTCVSCPVAHWRRNKIFQGRRLFLLEKN